MILCPLENVSTIITDDGVTDEAAAMVESAGVTLITVKPVASAGRQDTSSVA
jgi:DeoR family transcriptional regulator, ulaG and ulaABCDEF operon transcriptional repressor